jgi:hypothetical protein
MRAESSGGCLCTLYRFLFHKRCLISLLNELISDFQEGICFMNIVNFIVADLFRCNFHN